MFPLESCVLDLLRLLFLPIGGSGRVACLPDATGHVNTSVNPGVYWWQIGCQILLTALAQIPHWCLEMQGPETFLVTEVHMEGS